MIGVTSKIGAASSTIIQKGLKAGKPLLKPANLHSAYNKMGRGMRTVQAETASGKTLGASLVKGAATSAAWAMAPEVMYGIGAANLAVKGANNAIDFRRRRGHQIAGESRYNTIGRGFQDSNQASTMRQAATQQIQANKMNARSALGGEARIFASKTFNQHRRPQF